MINRRALVGLMTWILLSAVMVVVSLAVLYGLLKLLEYMVTSPVTGVVVELAVP